MNLGIYDRDLSEFHLVAGRKDLQRSDIQALLKRSHLKDNLLCGCGIETGRELRLGSRRLGPDNYTCVRETVEDHPSECVLQYEGDGLINEKVWASDIFEAVDFPAQAKVNEGDFKGTLSARRSYGKFNSYARRILAAGCGRSFIAKNAGAGIYQNPCPREVCEGIHQAINSLWLTSGVNGYEACRRLGCRLRFGLIYERLASDEVLSRQTNVYWWEDSAFSFTLNPVEPSVLQNALRDLRIFDHIQSPPYFVLAVQSPEGRLEKIFLHQVWCDSQVLVPTDSGTEKSYVRAAVAEGLVVSKVVLTDETDLLLRELTGVFGPDDTLRYRADFLLWKGGVESPRVRIRELRGFVRGMRLDYDHHLDGKGRHFTQLCAARRWEYREFDGTTLPRSISMIEPIDWPSSPVHYGGVF